MEAGRWFSMWEKWVGGGGGGRVREGWGQRERERERERGCSLHTCTKRKRPAHKAWHWPWQCVWEMVIHREGWERSWCAVTHWRTVGDDGSQSSWGLDWSAAWYGVKLTVAETHTHTQTQLTKTKQTPKHGNLFGRHSLCFWFLIRYHFRHDTFNFLAPPSPHPKKKLQLKVSLNITSPISQRSVLISLHQFLNVYINYYNWDDCCHHKKGLGC